MYLYGWEYLEKPVLSEKREENQAVAYASEPRWKYLKGPETASSEPARSMPVSLKAGNRFASLLNFLPRYFPCWAATWAVFVEEKMFGVSEDP